MPQQEQRASTASRPAAPVWLMARWACVGFVLGVFIHNGWPLTAFPWWIPGGLICIAIAVLGLRGTFTADLCEAYGRRPASPSTDLAASFGQRGESFGQRGALNGQRRALPLQMSLFIIACAFGMMRFDLTLPTSTDALGIHASEQVTMKTEIQDLGKYDAIMRVIEIDGISAHSRSKLSVASAGKGMKIGETWRVVCRVEKNEKAEMKQVLFDARKGIFYRCKGSVSAQRISAASPWNVEVMLASWRTWMTQRIYRLMPGDEGALLAGILYGERGLSAQENQAFRMAGMTHIIAVSGSNITIVIGLFVPIFLGLGYRRKTAIWFSGLGVILFSIFVGASASVLRAALMGWFAILARVFGRRADAGHLLLLAGSVMIVFDPWVLGYDAGFALSFLATWGLLVPGRMILKKITWIPEFMELRETFATTLAASLATAPYQLWAFGSVSLLGLATNLFAIPLTAFTMAWGATACVFGDVMPWIIYPARGMLSVMLAIASFAERFPFLVINYEAPLWIFLLTMMLGLLIFQLKLGLKLSYPQLQRLLKDFLMVLNPFVRRRPDIAESISSDFTERKQNEI